MFYTVFSGQVNRVWNMGIGTVTRGAGGSGAKAHSSNSPSLLAALAASKQGAGSGERAQFLGRSTFALEGAQTGCHAGIFKGGGISWKSEMYGAIGCLTLVYPVALSLKCSAGYGYGAQRMGHTLCQ